jgi:catalase
MLFNPCPHPTLTRTSIYVQPMTPQQAENFLYNVLELTKVWPHKEFPLRPVGKIVLDENPQNYFAEIEQVAFFSIPPLCLASSRLDGSES